MDQVGKFNDKDDNGNAQLYAGNRFRLTPKNSFAIGFDLNVPAGEKASRFAGLFGLLLPKAGLMLWKEVPG